MLYITAGAPKHGPVQVLAVYKNAAEANEAFAQIAVAGVGGWWFTLASDTRFESNVI